MGRNEYDESRSPFGPVWVVCVSFLLLVLVAGGWVVLRSEPVPPTAPAASPSASSWMSDLPAEEESPAPQVSERASCELDHDDQDIPVAGPPASWEASQYVMLPHSPEVYGPGMEEGALWGCFAHSPTGALFAAVHIFAGLGEPSFADFAGQAMVESPGLSAWLAEQDPSTRVQRPGQVAQLAGFQFQGLEPDRVVVALGFREGDLEASVRIGVVWDDERGTWLGDFNSSSFIPERVALATFTPWSVNDG